MKTSVIGDGYCRTCKWWLELNSDNVPRQGVCDGVRIHEFDNRLHIESNKSMGCREMVTEETWGCMSHSDYTEQEAMG